GRRVLLHAERGRADDADAVLVLVAGGPGELAAHVHEPTVARQSEALGHGRRVRLVADEKLAGVALELVNGWIVEAARSAIYERHILGDGDGHAVRGAAKAPGRLLPAGHVGHANTVDAAIHRV